MGGVLSAVFGKREEEEEETEYSSPSQSTPSYHFNTYTARRTVPTRVKRLLTPAEAKLQRMIRNGDAERSRHSVMMNVGKIRYTQDSISRKFRNGHYIDNELINAIDSGEEYFRDFPSMTVFYYSETRKFHSLDNRRLYLFKKYKEEEYLDKFLMEVDITSMSYLSLGEKYTTHDDASRKESFLMTERTKEYYENVFIRYRTHLLSIINTRSAHYRDEMLFEVSRTGEVNFVEKEVEKPLEDLFPSPENVNISRAERRDLVIQTLNYLILYATTPCFGEGLIYLKTRLFLVLLKAQKVYPSEFRVFLPFLKSIHKSHRLAPFCFELLNERIMSLVLQIESENEKENEKEEPDDDLDLRSITTDVLFNVILPFLDIKSLTIISCLNHAFMEKIYNHSPLLKNRKSTNSYDYLQLFRYKKPVSDRLLLRLLEVEALDPKFLMSHSFPLLFLEGYTKTLSFLGKNFSIVDLNFTIRTRALYSNFHHRERQLELIDLFNVLPANPHWNERKRHDLLIRFLQISPINRSMIPQVFVFRDKNLDICKWGWIPRRYLDHILMDHKQRKPLMKDIPVIDQMKYLLKIFPMGGIRTTKENFKDARIQIFSNTVSNICATEDLEDRRFEFLEAALIAMKEFNYFDADFIAKAITGSIKDGLSSPKYTGFIIDTLNKINPKITVSESTDESYFKLSCRRGCHSAVEYFIRKWKDENRYSLLDTLIEKMYGECVTEWKNRVVDPYDRKTCPNQSLVIIHLLRSGFAGIKKMEKESEMLISMFTKKYCSVETYEILFQEFEIGDSINSAVFNLFDVRKGGDDALRVLFKYKKKEIVMLMKNDYVSRKRFVEACLRGKRWVRLVEILINFDEIEIPVLEDEGIEDRLKYYKRIVDLIFSNFARKMIFRRSETTTRESLFSCFLRRKDVKQVLDELCRTYLVEKCKGYPKREQMLMKNEQFKELNLKNNFLK